jgi:hypothetical protein
VTTLCLLTHASRKHFSFLKLVCTKRKLSTRVNVADKYPEFTSPWRNYGNFLSHTSDTHEYKAVRHDSKHSNMLRGPLVRRLGTVTMCLIPREMYEVIGVIETLRCGTWPRHKNTNPMRYWCSPFRSETLCRPHHDGKNIWAMFLLWMSVGRRLQNDKSRHSFQQTMIFFRYKFQVNAFSANHCIRLCAYLEKKLITFVVQNMYVFTEIFGPTLVLRFSDFNIEIKNELEVLVSDLYRDTTYPDWCVSWHSSVLA